MDTLEIMKAARELLSDEKRWCKGAHAEDSEGNQLRYADMKSAKRCIRGAIQAVAGLDSRRIRNALLEIEYQTGCEDIVEFNDDPATQHSDVLALLDEAISKAGEP